MEIGMIAAAAAFLIVLWALSYLSKDRKEDKTEPRKEEVPAGPQEETMVLLTAAMAEELGVSASRIKITV